MKRNSGRASVIVFIVLLVLVIPAAVLTYTSPRTGYVEFAKDSNAPECSILFIGSNLIYTNDLPAIVTGILRHQQPQQEMKIFALTASNRNLANYVRQDETKKVILEDGPWRVIVLQDSVTSFDKNAIASLTDTFEWFDQWIRGSKARPALLTPWSAKADVQSAIDKVYRGLAAKSHAIVIPAGELMALVSKKEPAIPLYAEDGKNATPYGSYLVACLICNMVAQVKSEGAPGEINETALAVLPKIAVGIPNDVAKKLQKYADQFAARQSK